eukprot:gnl/MRDRNA2_/MRDRNA2_108644_c0_seq1.p1 gnl/MRDRNA2_/MRDRNA2_108644_c0~~gnl/MRDRNA2_/MRDRNA2_108644_c0_seq1.p1  ORF type:complete len:230 (-),score=56.70 gnl/MRDRNA2_/MRDRNA2_108644_c0_seq1:37-726(-)
MMRTLVAILAISHLVSGSSQRSIFDFLPRAELFPACLKTVSATLARRAPQTPITTEDTEPVCENVITSAPNGPGSRTTAVLADCAELSGRMEEAAKNGYLNDGSEFCSNILKQSAKEHDLPLTQYVPRGAVSKKKFCNVFSADMVDACSGLETDHSEEMTPASQLIHSADALDAPAMPHVADQSVPASSITNMVAATPAEDEAPGKMTKEYMKKNFGSILRFGGGSTAQ